MEEYKPVGLFIVKNDKNQYIYDDPFIKGGYMIHDNKYKNYRVYASRYIIGLIAGVLFSTLVDTKRSIIIGVATAIIGEILFRVKFLKTCAYLPNYKRPEGTSFFDTITSSTTTTKKLIKVFLFLALSILIVINAYEQNYSTYILVLCWIVSVISFIMSIMFLIAYIKDRGEK